MAFNGKGKGSKTRSSSTPPLGSRDTEDRPSARRAASPAPTKGRGKGADAVGAGADADSKGKGNRRSESPAPTRGREKGKGSGKEKGQGKRSSSAPPRATVAKDWTNPDGWSFDDITIGSVVEGIVTNTGPYGVFIDIGAERNVRLNAGLRDQRRFRRGDVVASCLVDSFDADLRRATVQVENIDESLELSRRALEEFKEGDIVDGVIDGKGPSGVFVNIGAMKDGRLRVPVKFGRQFVRGQIVRNMVVEYVDLEKQWIGLQLEDLEAAVSDFTIISLSNKVFGTPVIKGKGKSNSKPKAKAKAAAKAAAKEPLPEPVEEVAGPKMGSFCDGVVTSVTARDIIVEIDGAYLGTLKVSPELRDQFQPGDHVQGMKVEKVGPRGIVVSMEDPELEVEEEARLAMEAAKLQAKGGKGGKSKNRNKGKA